MEETEIYYDSLSDVPSDFADSDDSDLKAIDLDGVPGFSGFSAPQIVKVCSEASHADPAGDLNLDWSDRDPPRIKEDFLGQPGPRVFVEHPGNVHEVASLFLGDDIFQMLVEETNRYHNQNHHKRVKPAKSGKWTDVTFSEIKKFFALLMLMSQVRKNTIGDYWSGNPLIETPIFPKTMSRQRFQEILTYLHFENNETVTENGDRLYKIQRFMNYFLDKFNNVYKPNRDILIGETIIAWRGKLPFKNKTIQDKQQIARTGIQTRMLCEAGTGYICNFKLYTNGENNMDVIVKDLLSPCANLNHHLYLDNNYTTIALAENLMNLKTRICGSIKKEKGFPLSLNTMVLKANDCKHQRKGEVLAQIWMSEKSKLTRMVSTIHNSDSTEMNRRNWKTGKALVRPTSIVDYRRVMTKSSSDQNTTFFFLFRKTKKWTKKVALYIFNCAISNSFIVYNALNPDSKMRYDDYILRLARAWLEVDLVSVKTEMMEDDPLEMPSTSAAVAMRRRKPFDPPDRLSGDMMVHKVEKIINVKTRKYARSRCKVCLVRNLRRETSFFCKACLVPLHVGKCFENYHTKKDYSL